MGAGKGLGAKGSRLLYGEHTKGDTPPIRGAARAFYPHNFSRQKSRKKFAPRKHNFSHQKYSKKSPWSDWKNFRKKFVGKCFGEEKAPNLVERGQGAKIRKSVFVGKDSVIIRDYKRRVLSFCFRTIGLCLCLVGHCLYDLPSFGT